MEASLPVQARIYEEFDLVYVTYSGKVMLPEIKHCMKHTFASPHYDPGMNELGDLRDVTEVDIGFQAMMTHANQVQNLHERSGRKKILCLVAESGLGFGMARMFQSLADIPDAHLEVHVLNDMAEAKRILGATDCPI